MDNETRHFDPADAIMTRRFELDDGQVDLYIWAPVETGKAYPRCHWQIVGMGTEVVRHCDGVDSADAVHEALKLAAIGLYNSPEWRDGRLTWLDMRDLGLPNLPGDRLVEGGYAPAALLSLAGWQAVVRIADQPMPYLAWSDEAQASHIRNLKRALADLETSVEDGRALLRQIIDGLLKQKRHYEAVCEEAGLPPPPAGHDK